MAQPPSLASLVTQELRKFPQLDPKAVLAVASQEGLGGGIGDQGTSFGPWQLHQGGAYPSSAPQAPAQAQQWATSPAGIDYALSRINSVAGGMKGGQAVANIVSRFERPANPGHEIAGAQRAYGGIPVSQIGAGSAPTILGSPSAPSGPAAPRANPQLAALIGSTNQMMGLGGSSPLLAQLLAGKRG